MATRSKSGRAGSDAIDLLTADHQEVKALFKKFASMQDDEDSEDEKATLVTQICDALTIHAEIEEEIFYPALRAAIDDNDLMDEALVEHAGAKNLIAELREMEPDDELFDAKVTVLGEQIDQHVKEAEGSMFPKAKKAKVNTEELGAQLAARKQELAEELGGNPSEAEGAKQGSSRPELRR